QAAGKIAIDVEELGVDMLSLSGHKFHGPKGVGLLYVRRGVPLESLIHGGQQESGLRAGTENVPAIAGMGKAAELALENLRAMPAVRKRRDLLQRGIMELIPLARLNGPRDERLPNTLNMTLPGLRGESLVVAMDQHGISFSSGSACKSGSPQPTHVLMAMGRSEEEAHCSVRFSLDTGTSTEAIDTTLSELKKVLEEIESTIRFLPCK
ncbi:MAG TPA: aminotransferase class V-fold PLP-dependent enzyme, partial [Caldithrix abyssi]|nr:aminotransferase class V-fold PLP-dependent enzyme [Caldithrix abyssi]